MDTVKVYLASMLLIQTLCVPPELNDYICYLDTNETYTDSRPSAWFKPIVENEIDQQIQQYPKRIIRNTSDFVDVQCVGELIETMMECMNVLHPSKLKLSECILPVLTNKSLAITLRAINIEVNKVTHLELNDITDDELQPILFDNLNLISITISYKVRDLTYRPFFKLIDALTNLSEIILKNYILSPLPPSTIKYMTLINSKLEHHDFGDCKDLSALTLTDFELKNISLVQCFKLVVLRIIGEKVTESELFNTISDVKSLKELVVHGSQKLVKFTRKFKEAKLLRRLNLSGNRLSYVELRQFTALEALDLSSNRFIYRTVLNALMNKKRLLNVNLSYNSHLHICEFNKKSKPISHKYLQRLSLVGTLTSKLCFNLLESLKYLDLRNCSITELNFGGLPQSRARFLEVDLRGNPLLLVEFSEDDYYRLRYVRDDPTRIASIKIHADFHRPLYDCDCNHAYLASALRERFLNITNLRCVDGTALEDTHAHVLECDKYDCERCTCRRAWNDSWTVANCRGLNLLALPSIPEIHMLQAGGNSIQMINASILINSNITMLNLTNNKISSLDESELEALFAANRQVWLAGNPIMCECDNRLMIEGLQAHSSQVKDYTAVSCFGTGQPVHNVSVAALCAGQRGEQWPALLGGGGALVALAALAGALYLRYGRVLQVFLYARGWCLCCVREDELDADRIYDAFVSFSHHDEAFVVDELVPGLENARDYRLCVHFRDWMVGEWIPEQIARSIEQSRRTVIVLSKSYLESTWGLLEFRMAHASAMEEGRARIIVVVLDEVVEDERLDAELRGYLRTNTYVRWGDRWFWEKLQYAMPRGALRGRPRDQGDLPELEILPRIPQSVRLDS